MWNWRRSSARHMTVSGWTTKTSPRSGRKKRKTRAALNVTGWVCVLCFLRQRQLLLFYFWFSRCKLNHMWKYTTDFICLSSRSCLPTQAELTLLTPSSTLQTTCTTLRGETTARTRALTTRRALTVCWRSSWTSSSELQERDELYDTKPE